MCPHGQKLFLAMGTTVVLDVNGETSLFFLQTGEINHKYTPYSVYIAHCVFWFSFFFLSVPLSMQVCWFGSAPIKTPRTLVLVVVHIPTILSTNEPIHVCAYRITSFSNKMLSTHSPVPLPRCHEQYVGGIREKKARLYECSFCCLLHGL